MLIRSKGGDRHGIGTGGAMNLGSDTRATPIRQPLNFFFSFYNQKLQQDMVGNVRLPKQEEFPTPVTLNRILVHFY